MEREGYRSGPRRGFRDFLARARAASPWLYFTSMACAVLSVALVIALPFDNRVIAGEPALIKPLKFSLSIFAYCAGLLWFLLVVPNRSSGSRRAGNAIAMLLIVEIVLISYQALRGVRSHFNFTTTFDAVIYEIMGISIAIAWLLHVWLAYRAVRAPWSSRCMRYTIVSTMLLTAMGMGVAYLMTNPTDAQMALMESGNMPATIGAHTVGAPDGQPGMPITGWSREHGDLRIPHFVGLHALQLMPIFGFLVMRKKGWSEARRILAVFFAAILYACLIVLLTLQALAGQPLFGPAGWISSAFVGWFALAALLVCFFAVNPHPAKSATGELT